MKILVDADMFAYTACASAEQEVNWSTDVWSLWTDLSEAKTNFIDKTTVAINRGLEKMQFDGDFSTLFCFSDTTNFRKKIAPTYKLNRQGKRKPCGYAALVDWIKDEFTYIVLPELEADDCLGILGTQSSDSLIISGDKDMKSIPCRQYDFLRDEYRDVSQEEADRWFFKQTLMGDVTDGYSGCPKVGDKTADKILDKDCSWDAVVKAYEKAKLTEDDALTNARLARILRKEDWDFDKKKVKLWKP